MSFSLGYFDASALLNAANFGANMDSGQLLARLEFDCP